jgi:phytoene desaturase
MSKRIVIVGAGPGGLASAMLLARAGLEVTVLEKASCVGGRTSTYEAEGYKFDIGPTFFLYPQILAEIFSACGFDLWREAPMTRLDPQYHLIFGGGGDILASPDVAALQAEVAKLSPHDAAAIPRFLSENREKFERFRPILQNPFESVFDLFSPTLLKMLPLVRPWRSLDSELGRYFRDPRIRLAFSFQSKYLGMSPFQCPSLFSILSFLEYEYGVFHPRGGCGAVSKAMARVARQMGVEIRLDEPVRELLFDGRRVTGARTDEAVYKADAVIVGADFAHAMSHLIPDQLRRRWSDKKLAKKKYSCSTFMMYLGVEGLNDQLAHHTIHMSAEYKRNLDDIEKRHILSEDPSFYVQNASVTDPTLAPPGHSTLYVLVPVTHAHPNVTWDEKTTRDFRQVAVRQLGKIGLDNIEDRIRFERIVTPANWQNDFSIYRGATFNLAHNLTQMLHMRPHNRFEEFGGMYLTGGGTHPGSGLPVIYESARISTRLLLEDLQVETDFLADTTVPTATAAEVA